MDGKDQTKIKARSATPLMGPMYAWETGQYPYLCNAPNVVFLEAAYPIGQDMFVVFFGGADANIGQAVIKVSYSNSQLISTTRKVELTTAGATDASRGSYLTIIVCHYCFLLVKFNGY